MVTNNNQRDDMVNNNNQERTTREVAWVTKTTTELTLLTIINGEMP